MISYPIDSDELMDRVNQEYPTWGNDWRKLKPLFGEIQHQKCAYCERKLRHSKHTFEGDIDHFRPKSKYPRLAYNPANYVLTCSICNRSYKGDGFPIKEQIKPSEVDSAQPTEEDPDLIHPLDPKEPKLEEVIGFKGMIARSIARQGSREEERANAMIDFFSLNERADLREERVRCMERIYLAFTQSHDGVAQTVLKRAENASQAHTNFSKCYLSLCQTDPQRAKEIVEAATGNLK